MADSTMPASQERLSFTAALPRLEAALRQAGVIRPAEAIEIERQFEAGQSNPTYLLATGERRLVLRKQPYGHLLPRAHDVVREHNIMQALGGAGFTVPHPLFASDDREIIGTSFFVMDYVPGAVHSDPALPNDGPAQRCSIYEAMAGTMARLHRIEPSALEAAGVKPRGDFIGRQIGVWRGAYLAAMTEDDPRIEAVGQWLLDHKPKTENIGIVHGDYRIENLIFQGSEVAAVLDWELCTVGEPLADLAYCCIWYHLPQSVLNGLADQDLQALGIPDESEFLDIYSRASGIDAAATRDYFLAFAFYRLAAILQGVYKRALDGNAASPQALTRGRVAELCLTQAAAFAARA
ncbi:phosphotransferase family protein (plasmid) [Bosea sp. F3-2]|uniref:phosphotransferase family protein n=1 Tax=Bosea sp. F3-2 TaxID=2599640 RepID=UPI0011EEAB19|nr:phosphotransferase family protein [Bosea sp. F3-2]QEL27402.1 phosphotransferase family protein [Bosea sp. F3-2]